MNWRDNSFRTLCQTTMSMEQRKRWQKLYEEEFFLLDTKLQSSTSNKIAIFDISGSKKTIYQVNYYQDGTFYCNCPDGKVHCSKKQCVCKHVCFLLIRVLKYMKVDFYGGRKLSTEDHTQLVEKVQKLNQFVDSGVVNPTLKAKYEQFKSGASSSSTVETLVSGMADMSVKSYEGEDCPICFDVLDSKVGKLEECSTCHNGIHSVCLTKWLESSAHKDCVYCRSVWNRTVTSSSSGKTTVYNTDYVQL